MRHSRALTPETGLEQLEQATPANSVSGLQHPAGDDRVEPLSDLSRLQDGVGASVAPVGEADPVDIGRRGA
ncbi:MAG: hypothetical protein GEU68_16595 [Actinobacteria bacterium]|nr:hypothetical protein [Actinomycetota bacterium]